MSASPAGAPPHRFGRPFLHPAAAAIGLLLGAALAGYAGNVELLVVVAGAAAGFANSGST